MAIDKFVLKKLWLHKTRFIFLLYILFVLFFYFLAFGFISVVLLSSNDLKTNSKGEIIKGKKKLEPVRSPK